MTRILMISTDGKILEEGSGAQARMKEYGGLFDELHIILFTKKSFQTSFFGFKEPSEIAANVYIYPTNSVSKLLCVHDATRLGTRILRKLGKGNDLVITAQDPFETGLVGRGLSRKFKIPLHVQIHTDFMSPHFRKGSALNRIRLLLSKKTLSQAKAIRAVSERIKRELRDPKVSVLPIYADLAAVKQAPVPVGFKQKNLRFEKTVLMASRLTREKDIGTALEAFSLSLSLYPQAGLIVAGSGPELSRLQSFARSLGIGERVEWKPWMDLPELVSYMKTCDAFLSSSLYEGYGLSMLEAHASGATLAATDAGIAPLLAHEKCLAIPGDAKSLGHALINALSGAFKNREYAHPYPSKAAYLEAYRKDLERALGRSQTGEILGRSAPTGEALL